MHLVGVLVLFWSPFGGCNDYLKEKNVLFQSFALESPAGRETKDRGELRSHCLEKLNVQKVLLHLK